MRSFYGEGRGVGGGVGGFCSVNFISIIKLHEQINDEWSVAGEIGNLGLIYFVRGEYDLAIENFQLAHEKFSPNLKKLLHLIYKMFIL